MGHTAVASIKKTTRRRNSQEPDAVCEAALNALALLMDPILDFVFDLGVSAHDINSLIRAKAVQVASQRLIREEGVSSKSRVAIITGLPRSEVTKLLGLPKSLQRTKLGQSPARRTLAGWLNDPRFLTPSGEPAVLPIFGKRRSFEQLVSKYSPGIPLRAMLDEVIRIGAVDRLPDQRVRACKGTSTSKYFDPTAIEAVGKHCRDLLVTLIQNLRGERRMFESTTLVSNGNPHMLHDARVATVACSKDFIDQVALLFKRYQTKDRRASNKDTRRAGVTIFYFEDLICPSNRAPTQINRKLVRRKNLRRRPPQ